MKREKIEIETEFIKLDALLKLSGYAGTGGHAKAMIIGGEIKVDGAVCEMRGKKMYPGMIASLQDIELEVCRRAD